MHGNLGRQSLSKHLDNRIKFVARTIADNIVRVRYTPTKTNFTETNLADILTKSFPRTTFERLRLLCPGIQVGDDNVSERLSVSALCMCTISILG